MFLSPHNYDTHDGEFPVNGGKKDTRLNFVRIQNFVLKKAFRNKFVCSIITQFYRKGRAKFYSHLANKQLYIKFPCCEICLQQEEMSIPAHLDLLAKGFIKK